jgi:hypothetical protein
MSTGREPLKFNTRRAATPAHRDVAPGNPAQAEPTTTGTAQASPAPDAPALDLMSHPEPVVAPSVVAEPPAAHRRAVPDAPKPAVVDESSQPRESGREEFRSDPVPLDAADAEPGPNEVDISDSVVRPVSVYMPRSTYEALRDTAHNREMDYTSLVIEALNEHSAAVSPQFKTVGSVSGRTMPVRASRRRRGEGLEHIQLRLDGLQRQWLAARVAESGAPSRAAFVTAVLNRHLGVTVR